MNELISISVGEAVNLLTPEHGLKSLRLPYRELIGQQAHFDFYKKRKKLTNSQNKVHSCTPEVTIRGKYHSQNGTIIQLKGRIDILEQQEDNYCIFEFKSIFCYPENIETDIIPPRISLQIKLYAYLFHIGTPNVNPENIICKIVLYNLADQNEQTITIPWSVSEMEAKLEDLVKIHEKQKIIKLEQKKRRVLIGKNLSWLFQNYRSGQDDIIEAVAQTFKDDGDILINAPTGIGKTMAILLPALKHSLKSGGQLFYATAKGGGRNPIVESLKMMLSKGLPIIGMIMPSQSELCDKYPENCNTLDCDLYPESWDLSNKIDLPDSFKKTGVLLTSDFRNIGKKMKICPAIIARAASLKADIVIGDYNFIFSPYARLHQFNDLKDSNWTLLIDEAHNLIDRVREEFSFILQYDILNKAPQLLKQELWLHVDNPAAVKLAEALNSVTASFTRVIEELPYESVAEVELEQVEWDSHEKRIGMLLAKFLISSPTRVDRDLEKSLWKTYITLKSFSEILQRDQDKYLYLGDSSNNVINLCCLDPAGEMREMYSRFNNIAAFSGTLTPLDYHAMAMGFGEKALVKLEVPGWIDENNCLITVASGVDTRYNNRSTEASAIAKIIRDCIKCHTGGYLAVMPSFEFLEKVYDHFTDIDDHYEILVQKQRMSYDDRIQFTRLLKRKNKTTLAFVVAGGQFTEAEDYPGDGCVGVLITSPCLPPPDIIRNATLMYWDRQGENGQGIAYLYTGVRRVIQAGGRLLRRTDDRGIILLIGNRFLEQPVLGLLPQHWQESIMRDPTDWQTRIADFWLNTDMGTIK